MLSPFYCGDIIWIERERKKEEERQDEILHTQFPLVSLTVTRAFGADGIYSGVRGAAPS